MYVTGYAVCIVIVLVMHDGSHAVCVTGYAACIVIVLVMHGGGHTVCV
jgi:hypothetical protein